MELYWHPREVEQLRQLWDDGHSASAIGRQMERSRNSIIGKAHRLKLPARAPRMNRTAWQARANGAKAHAPKPKVRRQRKPSRRRPVQPRHDIPEPVSLDVSLIDLGPRQCKWANGDGPFLFCGHQTFDGSSYCEHHHGRCFTPYEGRRRHFVILKTFREAA